MNRGFRLGLVLCGLVHGDFIVTSYSEQIAQRSTVTLVIAAHCHAEQDCATKTPDKPTPSPKPKNSYKDSSDDLLSKSIGLFKDVSMDDLFPTAPIITLGRSAAVSPTSTNGQFDSAKTSASVSPALCFSVSPSTTSLPDLHIGAAEDCPTNTPDKPTPSPKHPSSPKK